MSKPPIVNGPVRPGGPRYERLLALHDTTVDTWGRSLAPTEELRERARQHALAIRERCWQLYGHTDTKDRYGHDWLKKIERGIIGAELWANQFGVGADWTVRDCPDFGWDVELPTLPSLHIDVKVRQGFLQIRPDQFSQKPDYYALVEQGRRGEAYVACGVITPLDFYLHKFAIASRTQPLQYAVTAYHLLKLAHFHPYAM